MDASVTESLLNEPDSLVKSVRPRFSERDSVSKHKMERDEREHHVDLWHPHAHVDVYGHAHMHITT